MKTSTSMRHAVAIAGADYAKSIQMMRLAGFDGVDVSMCLFQGDKERFLGSEWMDDMKKQKAALSETGMPAAQCHLPYFPIELPFPGDGGYRAYARHMRPMYERALNACAEIGCPVAVMHPYFMPGQEAITIDGNAYVIDGLLPLLEKNHVKLALENIYGENYASVPVSDAETILKIIDRVSSPLVGACIDTGHARIVGKDPAQMALLYGKKLFALHVNANSGFDSHAIPYSTADWCEKIDFHAFTRALKAIGFDGYYNLEISNGALPPETAQPYLNFAASVARALSK